jgi:hypothetical protein
VFLWNIALSEHKLRIELWYVEKPKVELEETQGNSSGEEKKGLMI